MSKVENISLDLPEIDADKFTSIKKVIEFLDKYLPSFPDDFRPRTPNVKTIRENLISRELNIYLNRLRRKNDIFMFEFQWEDYQSTRSSDVGVIATKSKNAYELTKAFFLIEAKRLPTDFNDKNREREYVSSDAGGMQRYKKGYHGAGLPDSALIGYIQKENCNHWHQKINEWISDLINTNNATDISWNNDDKLTLEKDFTNTKKFNSENSRIVDSKKDSIKIHHYLMELI